MGVKHPPAEPRPASAPVGGILLAVLVGAGLGFVVLALATRLGGAIGG